MAWQALRKGWACSTLYWQVMLVLFLVNLLAGLLLAAVPAAELLGPAHYTAIQDAASGLPAWMVVETFLNPVNNLNLEAGANNRELSSTLMTGIISILLGLVLLPLLSWVPGSLVNGGMLLTYFEGPALSNIEGQALVRSPEQAEGAVEWPDLSNLEGPALSKVEGPALSRNLEQAEGAVEWPDLSNLEGPALSKVEGPTRSNGSESNGPLRGGKAFRWRRFLWGCWHFWGAFLLFGLVQTILTLLVFIPVLAILSFIIISIPWSAILLVPAFLVLLIMWTGFVELSQVYLVAGEKRRIFTALGSALHLLRRRVASLVGYYSVSLLLVLLLHIFFRVGLFPRLPLAFWPLVLLVQQAFIFLRLWARASRLAGDIEFVRSLEIQKAGLTKIV